MATLSIRLRVDFSDSCSIGPGKITLLESIDRTGSLSAAARALGMSYRRAWLLVESLNTSFRRPVAALSTGGKGGGGAALTPFGTTLVAAYRKFEGELARRARAAFAGVARDAKPAAVAKVTRRRLPKHSAKAGGRKSARA